MRGDGDHVVAQLGQQAGTDRPGVESPPRQEVEQGLHARNIRGRAAHHDGQRLAFCSPGTAAHGRIEEGNPDRREFAADGLGRIGFDRGEVNAQQPPVARMEHSLGAEKGVE